MNRPCHIFFHEDSSPLPESLPERYADNLIVHARQGVSYLSLLVQNAFVVDYAPSILRTRVTGTKEEDPVDFPLDSISHIEWFYGESVPPPLCPQPHRSRPTSDVTITEVEG